MFVAPLVVLVALLVCLIPTTIGGLLSAIVMTHSMRGAVGNTPADSTEYESTNSTPYEQAALIGASAVLIPLAVATSIAGLAFPAIFAVGTTIPLLLFVALLAFGMQSVTPIVKRLRVADVWVTRIAAVVFILVGINEIILYWLA